MTTPRKPRPLQPKATGTRERALPAPAPAPVKRRQKPLRRVLSGLAAVVAVLGLGMALYGVAGEHYPPGYKQTIEKLIEWTTIFTDRESSAIQDRLKEKFATLKDPRLAKEGDPLTRLEIPKFGVNVLVVEGTSFSALKAGAGHYPTTPLPGARGNVAIAGHRTTYGRPFKMVDELRPGDVIVLTTPLGRHTYKVTKSPWIAAPNDWSVVAPSKDHLLTLTSCHPRGSAAKRIIVRAELTSSEKVKQR